MDLQDSLIKKYMMIKLTNERIDDIVGQKVYYATKENLAAVFKLLGLRIKEYSRTDRGVGSTEEFHSCSFEIHYKREFIIGLEADSSSRVISYNNEWVNFGDGCDGVAIPTEDVKEMLLTVLNLWVDKLCRGYDGPEYNEKRDGEYDGMEEAQGLLDHLTDVLYN